MYQVSKISAFSDNYIWSLHCGNGKCAVVDPGDSAVVLNYLEKNSLELTEILLTHHHSDHIGGVEKLKQVFPKCIVYGPNSSRFNVLAIGVEDQQRCEITAIGTSLTVISLPGHTIDHIGYFDDTNIFVGDTLFSVGCGRLFEGTAEQLHQSLQRIVSLKHDLTVYCAHEYTLANIEFAKVVDPTNYALREYEVQCLNLTKQSKPTIPMSLREQREVNPFLRCDTEQIKASVRQKFGAGPLDERTCFKLLRKWKDQV